MNVFIVKEAESRDGGRSPRLWEKCSVTKKCT